MTNTHLAHNLGLLRTTRQNVLNATEGYTDEQLNAIPGSFGNNLIWNMGHLLVTQQLLCYGLSGLPMAVDADMVSRYRKGSRPAAPAPAREIAAIKAGLLDLIDRTAADYEQGLFVDYTPYTTSYHVTLNNIDEAIGFNNLHEAMHFGYMLALRKVL